MNAKAQTLWKKRVCGFAGLLRGLWSSPCIGLHPVSPVGAHWAAIIQPEGSHAVVNCTPTHRHNLKIVERFAIGYQTRTPLQNKDAVGDFVFFSFFYYMVSRCRETKPENKTLISFKLYWRIYFFRDTIVQYMRRQFYGIPWLWIMTKGRMEGSKIFEIRIRRRATCDCTRKELVREMLLKSLINQSTENFETFLPSLYE